VLEQPELPMQQQPLRLSGGELLLLLAELLRQRLVRWIRRRQSPEHLAPLRSIEGCDFFAFHFILLGQLIATFSFSEKSVLILIFDIFG